MNISKLAKFGYAKTQLGTPYYLAPEVWKNLRYDFKVDIWSLGCIAYELATLNRPFLGNNLVLLARNVRKGKYGEIPKVYSNSLVDFIRQCLQVEQKKRPSAIALRRLPEILKMETNIDENKVKFVPIKPINELKKIPKKVNNSINNRLYTPNQDYSKVIYPNQVYPKLGYAKLGNTSKDVQKKLPNIVITKIS